jgi:uncharacterized protein (DUF2267 family)
LSSQPGLAAIDLTVEQTDRWLDAVIEEVGWQDRNQAFFGMTAVLHTIRDRLTADDALAFALELPALLRGVFLEDWQPSQQSPRVFTRREFLRGVNARLAAAGIREDPESITQAVFRVLARNLAPATSAA